MLNLSFIFGNVDFTKCSPGFETSVPLSFIASATDCCFDAICHYLKLKIFVMYMNHVSLETTCPIWKTVGLSAYSFSDGCCCT